jgi:hypothetical protein
VTAQSGAGVSRRFLRANRPRLSVVDKREAVRSR